VSRYSIRGQRVSRQKRERAKELRRRTTPAEDRLWQALRRKQLDGLHFRRQQVIEGFIADFYCHAAQLVVEVDGPIHAKQQAYDAARDDVLRRCGLHVLRLTNDEVFADLPGCLARIRRACR
jgi:very-short-patch-repair endonuclease